MVKRTLVLSLLAMVACLVTIGFFTAALFTGTRPATLAERAFCEANYDLFGPMTGDCNVVPLGCEITEDDAWGRWDCASMGNRVCGSTIYVGGTGYHVNDRHRPGCFMEPSKTPNGWEVIFYPSITEHADEFGFEVPCPA